MGARSGEADVVAALTTLLNELLQKTEPADTQFVSAVSYTTSYEFDALGQLIYLGWAVPGSAKSGAVWKIAHLTWDAASNLMDIQFASGDILFTHIWDDRATLAYS